MPDQLVDLGVDPARGGWISRYENAGGPPPMRHAHRHNELEVNIVLRGSVDYLIADRRIRFPRHSVGWLLPPETHRLIHHGPGTQVWIAVFTRQLVAQLDHDNAGPPRQWMRMRYDDDRDGTRVRDIGDHIDELDRLCARLADPGVPAARHRVGLQWLLSECWRSYQSARSTPADLQLHPAVEAAARWLHDHAADPEANDLTSLARRCGISRPWLSKLFYEQLGESLTDYRNRQRFYRFRDLLAEPDTSTTSAALAAGFGSYTQCFRVVRQVTDLSPRDLAHRVRRT